MTTWGYSLRRLTATERIAGTDRATGGFVRRGCSHCAAEAEYLARAFITTTDAANLSRTAPRRRWLCLHHAERFARRHSLRAPAELPVVQVEQQVLPLGGE